MWTLQRAAIARTISPSARWAVARRGMASSSATASSSEQLKEKNRNIALYMTSLAIATLGLAYASVPLYKMFCQATGFGGTTVETTMEKANAMKPVLGAKKLTISFTGQTSSSLPWKFKPQQKEIRVVPGETALAFFTASNPTDKPVTGVATYNVTPNKAGNYFHKIQCFCFDEQRLRPHEQVDMPVFFYIDPEFLEDPAMSDVTNICLSYTFFKAKNQEDEE